MDSRKTLKTRYKLLKPLLDTTLTAFTESVRSAAYIKGLSLTIRSRVKDFNSLYTKILNNSASNRESREIPLITDILGIRIICPYLEEVELISNLLKDLFQIEEFETKGSEYPYQHFGYESVHLLIRIPDCIISKEQMPVDFLSPCVCEVQVRTILQEAWAEVDHELNYKSYLSPIDEPLKRKLAALNANLTLSDIMFQEIRDYQRELHSALKQRRKSFYNYIHRETGTGKRPVLKENLSGIKPGNITQKTIDSLLLKGLLAHNEEQFSEAVNIYTDILNQNISNNIKLIILIHRGMAYFSGGQHESAFNDFSSVIKMEPEHARARYYRSVYFRIEKKFSEAFNDLKICIQEEPYNLEYLAARAETLAAAGDTDAAIADCKEILCINEDFKPVKRLLKRLKVQSPPLE